MNAKKIMGAVLVALLAAALFVGAASAAEYGPVFPYQNNVTGIPTGTWTLGSASVTIDGGVIPNGDVVAGTYKQGSNTLVVMLPAISVDAVAGVDANAYKFAGGVYYTGTHPVNIDVKAASKAPVEFALYLTKPNGEETLMNESEIEDYLNETPAVGDYSIRAKFDDTYFATGTLVTNLVSAPVTFKVAEAGKATLTASVDTILKGENFKLVITGQPGITYKVQFDAGNFNVPANQIFLGNTQAYNSTFNFVMPNTGSVEFVIAADGTAGDSEKIEVWTDEKQASLTIKLMKGTLSAKTDAASYFIGDTIEVSITSTAGVVNNTIALAGTNFKNDSITVSLEEGSKKGEYSFELDTSGIKKANGKKLDVGTYTITIGTQTGVKATVPVVLKQPFISIADAPEVVVQKDKAEFTVNAEATTVGIGYYIFGTNFFFADVTNETVEDTENQFVIKLNESQTEGMDAGQYFMVIQHPMYDQMFNIIADDDYIILVELQAVTNGTNMTGQVAYTSLFDVNERQTANAAQALCDALDSQNIDDMYVKYSFFVVGQNQGYSISDIPAEVAKGDKIVISGVDTANKGKAVQVEMISTAFAAVPKETVGSAAFIVVTTEVADDGTWEITLDTSDLNVDEYSLSVVINSVEKKTATVNVVAAEDKPDTPDTPDVPDTPDTPDTPTEPETPGFGALAALAGLGAVAVLLLRRE